MSIVWLIVAAFLSDAGAALAQARRDPATVEVVYRLPVSDKVRVLPERRFNTADGKSLHYDAYLPADGKTGRAAIVFIGGAPSVRSWRWYQDHGRLAAAQGFVGLVPDKRFPQGSDGTEGRKDTADFLRHILADANSLGIDPTRICLWVFSAGGRIAPIAFDSKTPRSDCLVGFYPILDGAAEAATALDARRVPTLIVRAGRDTSAINASIAQFSAAALNSNLPITIMNLPDADHGFEGLNDVEASRTAMRQTYDFIKIETGR